MQGWQLMVATSWSTGGAVGHSPSFRQPGLPHKRMASEWSCCFNGSARLRRQASPHTADKSCMAFNSLHGEVTELLLPHSIGFSWVVGPSRFTGRKKQQKMQIPSFNGRRVKDYCGHYFKPSKDKGNNFKAPLRAILLQGCIFYYSQYSRYYFY